MSPSSISPSLSASSSSSRSFHIRIAAFAAILYLTSLQFKNLKALFKSDIGEYNLDAAWAPADLEDFIKQREYQTETSRTTKKRRR
eukprot:CAMPEP_0183713366 /NCGR_PEP_ID=MMETSP0737-20130205/8227_1 /TAXON_ID=385413 /ORGANISM="Thalassiosira miniscula, Strain CCMP1093" /LENGTH=85 /DNA_ID=CAMNT_0025942133 /DNA_START=7 /DNA_END=261 /DNA_ORIENTATION=-